MRVFLAAAVVAAVFFSSDRAEACSCRRATAPFDALQLSVNAQLPLLTALPATLPTLQSADGSVIPCDAVATSSTSFTLIPRFALNPGTNYSVDGVGFQTGASTDTTAPAAPTLTGSTLQPAAVFAPLGGCGLGGEGVTLDFTNPADEPVVIEVFAGPTTSSIDQATPVLVLDPSTGVLAFGERDVCSPHFALSSRKDLALQLRAVDFAGNVSGFSEAIQVKSSGCSATGGAALILLSALFLRRRRS